MNDHKIAYIVYSTGGARLEQCLYFLGRLALPRGMERVLYTVTGPDIFEAYQDGIQASDAAYCLCLTDEVFVIDESFLISAYNILARDGTVDIVGAKGTCEGEAAYDTTLGGWLFWNGKQAFRCISSVMADSGYITAQFVSGRIFFAHADAQWCPCAEGNVMPASRKAVGGDDMQHIAVVPVTSRAAIYIESHHCIEDTDRELRGQLVNAITHGEYASMVDVCETIRERCDIGELCEIANLIEVWELEGDSVDSGHSGLFDLRDWDEMREFVTSLRYLLMRIEYADDVDATATVRGFMESGIVSRDMIRKYAAITLETESVVWQRLMHRKHADEPLVSVIMPNYNGADLIARTLDSALAQTYRNIEILVVDDASTDGSKAVIESYRDARVHPTFLAHNRGVSNARNVALRAATGRYVAFLDSDDIWKPDKLEKQVDFMESHPSYGQCFAYFDLINKEDRNITWSAEGYGHVPKPSNNASLVTSAHKFFHCNFVGTLTSLCRADLPGLKRGVSEGLFITQDYEMWLRLSVDGGTYVLQENLASYRRIEKGRSNSDIADPGVATQTMRELVYTKELFIDHLTASQIRLVFAGLLPDTALEHLEQDHPDERLACARAFIKYRCEIPGWFSRMAELRESEICRDIYREDYGLTVRKYYGLNGVVM